MLRRLILALGVIGIAALPAGAAAPERIEVYINELCHSCKQEAPLVKQRLARAPQGSVTIVGWMMDAASTRAYARKLKYPTAWRVLGDPDGALGRLRGVCEPTQIVRIRRGRVVARSEVRVPGAPETAPPLPCPTRAS